MRFVIALATAFIFAGPAHAEPPFGTQAASLEPVSDNQVVRRQGPPPSRGQSLASNNVCYF